MIPSDETPRILVVDDERVIREVLADFLSMEQFVVSTAGDGQEALAELAREPYNLVLSDLKMPRMGGLELLEETKRRFRTTKTVIMTGFGTVESAIEAMKRGAHDYILKPFKVDEVVLTVRRALAEQRLEAENLRLREAISLYEASEKITVSLSLDDVLNTVASAALDTTHADEVQLLIADELEGAVERTARRDADAATTQYNTSKLMQHFEHGGSALRLHGSDAALFTADGPVPASLLAVPVVDGPDLLGVLSLCSFNEEHRFDEGQRKLASMLGSRAAAAIINARLYEDLQDNIHQTIEGLARAIDKLDPYTAGHSDRVATYAYELCKKVGLGDQESATIRQSAQMHDIGKIGCHLNLNKPGKLTAEEYEEFKKHPTFGKEILEPIAFLSPLVPGVHLHHERMDGHGYPLGIDGAEIPLMARIICIADSYDAMTSDRAYRKAMPHDTAVAELNRCAGTQFDAELVPLFIEAIDAWRARQ